MFKGFAPVSHPLLPFFRFARSLQDRFYRLIAHEEESGTGGRANDGGADTGIDAAETAGFVEAGGGLEAGF